MLYQRQKDIFRWKNRCPGVTVWLIKTEAWRKKVKLVISTFPSNPNIMPELMLSCLERTLSFGRFFSLDFCERHRKPRISLCLRWPKGFNNNLIKAKGRFLFRKALPFFFFFKIFAQWKYFFPIFKFTSFFPLYFYSLHFFGCSELFDIYCNSSRVWLAFQQQMWVQQLLDYQN